MQLTDAVTSLISALVRTPSCHSGQILIVFALMADWLLTGIELNLSSSQGCVILEQKIIIFHFHNTKIWVAYLSTSSEGKNMENI